MNYRLVYNILGKENKETEKGSVCAAETLNPNHIQNAMLSRCIHFIYSWSDPGLCAGNEDAPWAPSLPG